MTLLCVVMCAIQMMAINLQIEQQSGNRVLQDIAVIGKWVFEGDNLVLLDKEGNILATEAIYNIRKIVFAEADDTSLDNMSNQPIIRIYPNPTHDVLIVEGVAEQQLRVFDMQGRMLLNEVGNQVEVSQLADGTYLLQIGTQVVRFIKQ